MRSPDTSVTGKDEEGKAVYLDKVLHSIKQYSAKKANQLLDRKGAFWQPESFDYWVRDEEELNRIIRYVLHNPVKAGLCRQVNDWQWSYIKPEYNEFM